MEIVALKGAKIWYVQRGFKNELDVESNNLVLFDQNEQVQIYIKHPYKSSKIIFEYADTKYLDFIEHKAKQESLDFNMPNGTVFVKNDHIISYGCNGSNYHELNGCERVRLKIPTGQQYELCEGCSPVNHGEPKAFRKAQLDNTVDQLNGADAYMWGHWWCCESCNHLMDSIGIKRMVIAKKWTQKFLEINL